VHYQIKHKGAFPFLEIDLEEGESVKAESDAMLTMSSNIDLRGTMDGGFLRGLGRKMAGEKLFFQELTAKKGKGKVRLAPSTIGDIETITLDGTYRLLVQKDGFLAGTNGIQVSTKVQNLVSGMFSGAGFFVVEISGVGDVFLNAFGAIEIIHLEEGEELIVDNGHLVAWPDYMQPKITKASKGWISSVTSGESLVCKFQGEGPVLIQSRNPKAFGDWVGQFTTQKN